jgi:galactokinase
VINGELFRQAAQKFRQHYGSDAETTGYAPGRVEVLGNHTDYNEGFVLSAAINYGTFFLAARAESGPCRVVAGDLMKEARFLLDDPKPDKSCTWANYVIGVASKLNSRSTGPRETGPRRGTEGAAAFKALFYSNVPRGAGLASSAALEVSAGVALKELFGLTVSDLELARIGQSAEHEFAGVRSGLLDQITSLSGERGSLVMSDFRTLSVERVQLGGGGGFLICDSGVKHSLVESAYNERRRSCEEACSFFARRLDHPVGALRDVSVEEWNRLSPELERTAAKRAAHVIQENERVLAGRRLLEDGDIGGFGWLMFQSHESSRVNFENSCPELDLLVATARDLPQVMGARLSGGGFGGSAVMLLRAGDTDQTRRHLADVFANRFERKPEFFGVRASQGARLLS